MPGMPATGLGGIFYAMLVFWIVIREAWRALSGGSSMATWRRAGKVAAILAAILASFYLFGMAIERLAVSLPLLELNPYLARAIQALIPRLAVVPFAILAVLMVALQLVRWVLWRRIPTPAQIARPASTQAEEPRVPDDMGKAHPEIRLASELDPFPTATSNATWRDCQQNAIKSVT
jgi:hypothetical protein